MARKKLKKWTTKQTRRGRKSADAWQSFYGQRQDSIERSQEIDRAAQVNEAIDRNEGELLRLPNVAGIGASLKEKGGEPSGEISLSVFVEKKLPAKELGDSAVPSEIDGVETDVVEVGRIEPLAFAGRVRPAMPGYSIGHSNVSAGTFGCLVRDLDSPSQQHLLLGNNHVLADTNRGRLGDPILQPGPYDGGVDPQDTVAILERFEPIEFGLDGDAYNLIDAAVARPVSSRQVTASVIGSLIPQGVGQAFLGDRVLKAGRSTGVTRGRVLSVNATIVAWFPEGPARFRHQILTTFMSVGGDSGSLLMDRHLSAIGLVFGGSPLVTVASHIGDVESALGVRILTAPRQRAGMGAIKRQLAVETPPASPQPPPADDEEESSPPAAPPEDADEDRGPQPAQPEDEDEADPQPAQPEDEDEADPQPVQPEDEDEVDPQPVQPEDEDEVDPQVLKLSDGESKG